MVGPSLLMVGPCCIDNKDCAKSPLVGTSGAKLMTSGEGVHTVFAKLCGCCGYVGGPHLDFAN